MNSIEIFKTNKGETEIQVSFEKETVWLSLNQISSLFLKDKSVISRHLKNIYLENELEYTATVAKIATVQKEGKRSINRNIEFYNLDAILSVGYRVNSKIGTEFRKWATQKLKDYLIKGYAINKQLIEEQKNKLQLLEKEVDVLNQKVFETQKIFTDGFLNIISTYSKSFELLSKYDNDELSTDNLNKKIIYVVNYNDVKKTIQRLKDNLIQKGEAGELFGNEKDKSFAGILGSISQTIFGELAYPSIEEQAAQLLYSIIKGHAFSDGNKRIGSFVFVWFLNQNNFQFDENNQQKINDNTLVSLALAVAQSLPEQREIIIKLIINLIKN